MPKSKRWSNEKEDVIQIKATICNVLTITNENECKDLLLIKDKMAIKPGRNKTKRYTILIPKILPKLNSIVIFQLNSIWLYHQGFLAHTTPVYPYFFISHLIVGSSLDESNAIVHLHRRELNWRFSTSSVWHCLWETLIIQAIFRIDKRDFQSARWTWSKQHNCGCLVFPGSHCTLGP